MFEFYLESGIIYSDKTVTSIHLIAEDPGAGGSNFRVDEPAETVYKVSGYSFTAPAVFKKRVVMEINVVAQVEGINSAIS